MKSPFSAVERASYCRCGAPTQTAEPTQRTGSGRTRRADGATPAASVTLSDVEKAEAFPAP